MLAIGQANGGNVVGFALLVSLLQFKDGGVRRELIHRGQFRVFIACAEKTYKRNGRQIFEYFHILLRLGNGLWFRNARRH